MQLVCVILAPGYIRNKVFEKDRCTQVACVLFGPEAVAHGLEKKELRSFLSALFGLDFGTAGVLRGGRRWWRSWNRSARTGDPVPCKKLT